MRPDKGKACRVFDRDTSVWFEVPKDVGRGYDRALAKKRMKAQYYKHCCCPWERNWLCDGMCEDCKYRMAGNTVRLDAATFDEFYSEWELRQAAATEMEDSIERADLLERVIDRFRKLDKDADVIVSLWRDNEHMTQSAIAKALGRTRQAFSYQMARYRTEFRKLRGY